MKMIPFIVAATVVSIFSAWFYLLPKRKKRLIWNRKSQWNGWEEPFVTNRFKSELNALNKKKAQHVAGLK